MFIRQATIKNYRIFKDSFQLTDQHLGIPDGKTPGSGLTVFVGENGVGKTSILDALALPLISYKADSLELNDFCSIKKDISITLLADKHFNVKRTIKGDFEAQGFQYIAKIRSQNSSRYLVGTTVSDAQFIPAQGVSIAANSPDLRIAVENPFAGPRYSENDYLYIDKNRTKTLESGTFSSTRFDRVLQNLNFQYLKLNDNVPLDLDDAVRALIDTSQVSNQLLEEAFDEFKSLTDYEVRLSLVNDIEPFTKAFIGYKHIDNEQIPIDKIGSGYLMFLALVCQQKLSQQSGKKLIVFIDEIELHLHPKLQKELVRILLEYSKTAQIIISSHSPELLKDLQISQSHKINSLIRDSNKVTINPIDEFVLPTATISETNYVAFGLASMEYFIELYNQVGEFNGVSSVAQIDLLLRDSTTVLVDWDRDDGTTQQLTTYSCIRNKFHHPSNRLNDAKFTRDYSAVDDAIKFLRNKIQHPRSL